MGRTPEEIKNGLECCSKNKPYPCAGCPYERTFDEEWSCKLHSDALAYVQQLEAQVPKWISVDKRKPKRGEYVLFLYAKDAQNPVMHAKNPMVVGRYDYGMYLANGCEVKITHWMPLPPSPEEVK